MWPGRYCALIGQAWVTCTRRDGIASTLTIWTQSGGGVTSPKEMLAVVTRGEKDDEQAEITDVHYTHKPRLIKCPISSS